MTAAYSAADWTDFGVAVAGSAAALTGLLFVAVSINLSRILEFRNLPGRAGLTLILFAVPLITAVFLLVPGQGTAALAGELLATGIITGGFHVLVALRATRSAEEPPLTWLVSRFFPAVSCGCLAVAGATLLAGSGGGLYWLLPGVLLAIIFGLANAWVLLVEIQR